MSRLLLPSILASLSFLCPDIVSPGALLAQEPAPEVVTQQEQNELRAAAFKAEREGRYGDAGNAFLRLHRAEPDVIRWAIAAGRCLGRAGRFDAALDVLEKGHERWPTDPDLTGMLARTLILQTEFENAPYPEVMWEQAAALAAEALRADPNHQDSRLLLAQTHFLAGRWDDATAEAEEAARRHPDHPGAQILIGRIEMQRFVRLKTEFERTEPTDGERADQIGAMHRARTRAAAAFGKAAELDPTRAYPHAALSQLAEFDGRADDARRHLIDALAIDPSTSADHDRLVAGMDWQQRRDFYRELRERFENGTSLPEAQRRHKAASLWFQEGRALLDGHRFDEARAAFERTLADAPNADNAEYYAFLASYHAGEHDPAERHAAAYARRSAPRFADVLRALPSEQRVQIAAIVRWLGDRAYQQQRIDASRDLNHVIACLQDTADAWNNHAFLCRETGAFEQAFTSYQYAIEREPDSAQLWNDAAVVLQYHLPTEEHLAEARKMYGKALELAAATLQDADAGEAAKARATEARKNALANLAELDAKGSASQDPEKSTGGGR